MSCESISTLHLFFDGELDAVRAVEFERHLEQCAECTLALERMASLRAQLREPELYERASPEFRTRIRKQLEDDAPSAGLPSVISRRWVWIPAAAIGAVAAALAVVFLIVQPRLVNARISASLVDATVRSLQPGHLIDVQSTDSHTVKPWFEGKLDFVPPVDDFTPQGFRLVGGRLDVVDGHSAAVLVYARRNHFINLFIWRYDPDDKGSVSSGSARGYNWIIWQPRDMRFCLVSDVPAADLLELKSLVKN